MHHARDGIPLGCHDTYHPQHAATGCLHTHLFRVAVAGFSPPNNNNWSLLTYTTSRHERVNGQDQSFCKATEMRTSKLIMQARVKSIVEALSTGARSQATSRETGSTMLSQFMPRTTGCVL